MNRLDVNAFASGNASPDGELTAVLQERAPATALFDVHVRHKQFPDGRGQREVLRDVRLRIGEGEVVALVGASGCGKSTLLRIAAGLDRDADAQVRLGGLPVTGPTRDIRLVFQEPRLFPWLSVARNVAFDRDAGGGDDADGDCAGRVATLLEAVGLAGLGERLPKQLSGGQAQRVAIARGLFVRPRVLLLDEPFSAVDAFTRLKLQDLLLRLVRAQGVTVLMVTHDIDEAVSLSDRVLVFESSPGRIAAEVSIDTPQPRDRDAASHAAMRSEVRHALHLAHVL